MPIALKTAFTELVGCKLPIQLAPMAGVGRSPALPGAVAAVGGHAMVPAVMVGPHELAERIEAVAARTPNFGVNFIGLLLDRECLEVALARAPLVDFHFGTPDRKLIDRIHRAGALASWQVGSVEGALAATRAGCDLIVAQGCEAGGRLAGELKLLALLDRILDAVAVPVLAAGGIGTRAQVEAALGAGAAGVRIGTRFVASEESDAHPEWKQALVEARADDAVTTTRFSVGVPELPHRVLRSSILAASAHDADYVGEIDHDGRRVQVPRFGSYPPTRDAVGAIQAMPFYAGRSVAGVDAIKSAGDIVAELLALGTGADAAYRVSRREALGLLAVGAAGLAAIGPLSERSAARAARALPLRRPGSARLTRQYGIRYPIVGAGMGFYSGPPLVAAISNAGGLGVLGAAAEPPPRLQSLIHETRARTRRPFGVDLVNTMLFGGAVAAITDEHIEICARERVPLVVFYWDTPERRWVKRLRRAGVRVWMVVASLDGALAAIDAGVDGLVATGAEAGGHARGAYEQRPTSRATLVPRIVDAARGRIVLAAGGIATAQGVADAFCEGADGVWVGTRFAASAESSAHPEYKRRVVAASEHDVVLTTLFGPEWPDVPGWALRNRVVNEWAGHEAEIPSPPPPPPVIGTTTFAGMPYDMPKFSAILPTTETSGDLEEMWLSMGPVSAGLIHEIKPAHRIVTELAAGAGRRVDAR